MKRNQTTRTHGRKAAFETIRGIVVLLTAALTLALPAADAARAQGAGGERFAPAPARSGVYLTTEQEWVPGASARPDDEDLFDNTTFTGGFLPASQTPAGGPPVVELDWGATEGGTVNAFEIGYATNLPGPIRIVMTFYTGTTDAANGEEVARFDLVNLPGSGTGQFEVVTSLVDVSQTPFFLPPGPFGYGYEITDNRTGPLTAVGGTGVTDGYRVFPDLQNLLIQGFFAQFHLKLIGAPVRTWFVDNAGPNGDGSFASPFNNLADAEAASGPLDTIFIRTGLGPYGGIRLTAGQKLFGEGVGLVQDGQVVVPPGDPPVVTNPGGAGVELADDTEVGGLAFENNGGPSISASGLLGSLSLHDISTSGGTAGIDIIGGTGTFTFSSVDIANTGGPGVRIEGLGGEVHATGVRIDGGTTGVTIGETAGGTLSFSNLLVGNTADAGIDIIGGSGTFTFSSVDIADTGGPGLQISGTGGSVDVSGVEIEGGATGVSIGGTVEGTVTITNLVVGNTIGSGIDLIDVAGEGGIFTFHELGLHDTGGPGLQIDEVDGSVDVSGVEIEGGTTGVSIGGTAGGGIALSNIVLGNTIGAGVDLNLHGGTLTIGSIDIENTGGPGLQVGGTGGSVDVSGVEIEGGATGVSIGGTAGGSVSLANLVVGNTIGVGINISGEGGSVSFRNTAVTNPGGPALSIRSDDSMVTFEEETRLEGGGLWVEDSDADVRFGSLHVTSPGAPSMNFVNDRSQVVVEGESRLEGGGLWYEGSDGTYEFGGTVTLESISFGPAAIDVSGGRATISSQRIDVDYDQASTVLFGARIRESNADVTFGELNVDGGESGVRVQGGVGGRPRLRVSGGRIENTSGDGIVVEGGSGLSVKDVILRGSGGGVTVRDTPDVDFLNVTLDGPLFLGGMDGDDIITIETTDSQFGSFDMNLDGDATGRVRVEGNTVSGSTAEGSASSKAAAGPGSVAITVGGSVAVELSVTGNTVETAEEHGITVRTTESAQATVTLVGNDVAAAGEAFLLSQEGASTFLLEGFAGGDEAAVAAFLQENNGGDPSARVAGVFGAGAAEGTADVHVLEKSVSDATPEAGTTVVYTIRVANAGPADAAGVTVADLLPAGLTYRTGTLTVDGEPRTEALDDDGADFGGTAEGTVTATFDTIAVGIVVVVAFEAELDAFAGGTTITNTARVRARSVDGDGLNNSASAVVDVASPVAAEHPDTVPTSPGLAPGYPNPFDEATVFGLDLPSTAHVSLRIYDVRGRLVASLLDGLVAPGRHHLRWDGRDARGGRVASGLYLARLQAGTYVAHQRVLLVR